MTDLELIKQHLTTVERHLSLDIIIRTYDPILQKNELDALPEFNKWHLNKYCLKIKSDPSLHKKCVNLSGRFVQKVISSSGVANSTCFAGVTEYAKAVFWGDKLICIISATGYKGRLPLSIAELLCRRVGLSSEELFALRENLLPDANEADIVYAIDILELLILEYYSNRLRNYSAVSPIRKTNKYVALALEYINIAYTESISADDVAAHCFVSTAYLQRLFSENIGHGIAEEIRSSRLGHAKQLLSSTDFSVKQVALACGFNSTDYFSTLFKKEFGISPLKYKATYNKE